MYCGYREDALVLRINMLNKVFRSEVCELIFKWFRERKKGEANMAKC